MEKSNAPKLTEAMIASAIKETHFINAGEAISAAWPDENARDPMHPKLNAHTICILVLRNGYTVTGESFCVSIDNYDRATGNRLAYESAKDKIWQLEGYLLQQAVYLNAASSEDDQFAHFLSYSGYSDEDPAVIEKLKKAFFDGGYSMKWKEE